MPGGVHEFMKAWEPEEDQIIMEMLNRLGPKWSKIVQRLPGRTVSSVRNRWQRIDKGRRLREAGHESKNRCQQCGKPKRGHVCMARLKNRGESGELAAIALKQWESVRSTGDEPRGGDEEGAGEDAEVHVLVPQVNRSSSAPAALERKGGGAERPSDRGHSSLENAALLSQLSSGTSGFNALAAAAEAELKRTNSCELLRTHSCSSVGAGSNVSSSTMHSVLLSFGAGPPNFKREEGSQGSSTSTEGDSSISEISSTPSVGEEVDPPYGKLSADHSQRLAALVAADQRIFAGEELDEDDSTQFDASQVA
mmetsp:Transcript_2547/g.4957  ORF Transcript_2547/g.4957 Transcript_2547/m.4957 type:complete len:309 (+) Transcript_2547:157-1083(+)